MFSIPITETSNKNPKFARKSFSKSPNGKIFLLQV
jgi:hypothetical protein